MCNSCNSFSKKGGVQKCGMCNTWFKDGELIGKNLSLKEIRNLFYQSEGLTEYPKDIQDKVEDIMDDLTFECGPEHDEDWHTFLLTLRRIIELILLVPNQLNIGTVKTLNIS